MKWKICTLRNENLYFEKWKSTLCEMKKKNSTMQDEIFTLQNENLHFVRWKSVLCKMKICTLQNENLYFAKWKSVLCKMKICTLQNENLYFARWKSVLRSVKLELVTLQFYICRIIYVKQHYKCAISLVHFNSTNLKFKKQKRYPPWQMASWMKTVTNCKMLHRTVHIKYL